MFKYAFGGTHKNSPFYYVRNNEQTSKSEGT